MWRGANTAMLCSSYAPIATVNAPTLKRTNHRVFQDPVSNLERKGRTVLGVIEHARELCDLLEPIGKDLIQLGQSSVSRKQRP